MAEKIKYVWLDIACPECRVKKAEFCRDMWGPTTTPHPRRVKAFDAALSLKRELEN